MRTQLFADPEGRFLHDVILESCRQNADRTAIVDASYADARRITYGEYADLVERLARGLICAGLKPGERIGIFLPNSWEFCATYHAATLAGAIPTPMNPSYREREVRYQLENSGASMLVSNGNLIAGMNLDGLPALRRVYTTREAAPGCEDFASLLTVTTAPLPRLDAGTKASVAALPYSSGTTGLPKGVMLSHYNLVANVYQIIAPDAAPFVRGEIVLCFLPLYHIYGLNVVLNPTLVLGGTLVLMPRFDALRAAQLIAREGITFIPLVPPVLNAFCQLAEQGQFPRQHHVRWVKCGAAPLAPELGRRFIERTGIPVAQGYGMTEASPVTHIGYDEGPLAVLASIGHPVALTDCVLIDENGGVAAPGQIGELVMRGPQFMLGYWNAPEATADVLRPLPPGIGPGDGGAWYWSGDVARMDGLGLFYIVDRRKELIKYKGFAVAPAEIEAVLLEHPGVRDCAVVGQPDQNAGEIPCAFVVLRDPDCGNASLAADLSDWVASRLTHYKQPRRVEFVPSVPRNPSGKILRRELRKML